MDKSAVKNSGIGQTKILDSVRTQIKLLTGTGWMAREVLTDILWEVAECGAALDSARDLGEWEQPAPPVAPGPVRSNQEESILFKLLEVLDKSATASCTKTPGPAKGKRKKTAFNHGTVQEQAQDCMSLCVPQQTCRNPAWS